MKKLLMFVLLSLSIGVQAKDPNMLLDAGGYIMLKKDNIWTHYVDDDGDGTDIDALSLRSGDDYFHFFPYEKSKTFIFSVDIYGRSCTQEDKVEILVDGEKVKAYAETGKNMGESTCSYAVYGKVAEGIAIKLAKGKDVVIAGKTAKASNFSSKYVEVYMNKGDKK